MSNAYLCDECGHVALIRGAISWISVRVEGIAVITPGERTEWMFCSKACAARRFARESGIKTGDKALTGGECCGEASE